jgi:hypothetical protein
MNGYQALTKFQEQAKAVRGALADVEKMIAEKTADEAVVLRFAVSGVNLIDAARAVIEADERARLGHGNVEIPKPAEFVVLDIKVGDEDTGG